MKFSLSHSPTGNAIFREYSLSAPSALKSFGYPGTFKEHVKGKYFKTNPRWNSCFCVKSVSCYRQMANFKNYEAMFPEYSKNIPGIYVSKIFQGYHRNIVRFLKCFYRVKKFKKLFCELSCEISNIDSLLSWNALLSFIKTVFHWDQGA